MREPRGSEIGRHFREKKTLVTGGTIWNTELLRGQGDRQRPGKIERQTDTSKEGRSGALS